MNKIITSLLFVIVFCFGLGAQELNIIVPKPKPKVPA